VNSLILCTTLLPTYTYTSAQPATVCHTSAGLPPRPIVSPLVQTLLAQKSRPCKALPNQLPQPFSAAHELIQAAWISEQTHRHHPARPDQTRPAGKRASLTDVQASWSLVSTPTRTSFLAISTFLQRHPIGVLNINAPTTLRLFIPSISDRRNYPRSCPSSRPRIYRR
jgi:hypothetical protein